MKKGNEGLHCPDCAERAKKKSESIKRQAEYRALAVLKEGLKVGDRVYTDGVSGEIVKITKANNLKIKDDRGFTRLKAATYAEKN